MLHNDRSFSGSVGLADDQTGEANNRDTLFLMASNTKHIVATSLLKLEEMGLLRMSDSLAKYFPEYPAEKFKIGSQRITLELMMRNLSGLPEAYDDARIEKKLYKKTISFRELLQGVMSQPLLFAPGSKYEYADVNFLLGGEIIRRVTGLSFHAFTREFLFDKLGLNNLQVGNTRKPWRIARSYLKQNGRRRDYFEANGIVEPHVTDVFSDGNMYGTAEDVAKWARHLVQGRVVCEDLLGKMFTPSAVSVANGSPYGYAWNILKDAQQRTVYVHWGGYLGYQSFIAVYPATGLSVVWLGNQEFGPEKDQFFNDILQAAGAL